MYDEKGKKIARKYSSDSLNYLVRYLYNEHNMLSEKATYSEEGDLKSRDLFKYDNQDRLTSEDHIDNDSTANTYFKTYTVDSAGAKTQERVYGIIGYIKYSKAFVYDYRGNLIIERWYTSNGNFKPRRLYDYVVDAKGNWTSLIYKFKGGSFLTRREIQY